MTVFECVMISRKIACAAACLSPSEPARAISAKSLPILPLIVCSDNLILLGRDHSEIIRNSVSDYFPTPVHREVQHLQVVGIFV